LIDARLCSQIEYKIKQLKSKIKKYKIKSNMFAKDKQRRKKRENYTEKNNAKNI